jgi:NAD(P)-dependent dehydrogenase (short-subunit alcohol dehydrogenase family)
MVLEGKVALVTGGGSGIGKSVCLRLAHDGADIVVADMNLEGAGATAAEVRALGRQALEVQVNVSDPVQIQSAVDAAVEKFGRIDILVACAGIVQQKRMLDITEKDWDRVFAVNCKGLFFSNQIVAKQMVKQGGGAIVNMSSASGRGPRPIQAHYAASKAAVISITQTAAAALAANGVRVNAICPGIVETPMWDQIGHHQVGPLPGQAERDRPADAAATSSDQSHFPFQDHRNPLPLSMSHRAGARSMFQ